VVAGSIPAAPTTISNDLHPLRAQVAPPSSKKSSIFSGVRLVYSPDVAPRCRARGDARTLSSWRSDAYPISSQSGPRGETHNPKSRRSPSASRLPSSTESGFQCTISESFLVREVKTWLKADLWWPGRMG